MKLIPIMSASKRRKKIRTLPLDWYCRGNYVYNLRESCITSLWQRQMTCKLHDKVFIINSRRKPRHESYDTQHAERVIKDHWYRGEKSVRKKEKHQKCSFAATINVQLETCTITFDYREKRLLARFDTENEGITQRLASARLVTTVGEN